MDNEFIDILKQLVSEQTNVALTDAKRFKALLADYTRNEYKKESRFIRQAVEAGVAMVIDGADDLVACKKAQIRELREEYGLDLAVAAEVVNVLALVLRGDTTVTVLQAVEKAGEAPSAIISGLGSTFTDPRDGQVYRTVEIGGLVWMAENLNYKIEDSWCYDNDESNGTKYGRLYTWNAAETACPRGWHLPSSKEWDTLVAAAGGEDIAGKKLKSKTGWTDNNGTDEFGFSALPSGGRSCDGSFYDAGEYGYWWIPLESGSWAYYRYMSHVGDVVGFAYDVRNGLSVRCVEDCTEKPIATVVKPAATIENSNILISILKRFSGISAPDSTFTDPRDGQMYRTVKIGGLVWMAENLNYKIEDSWCYDDNESNGTNFGRLYTWDAAMAACPRGWHLPSREEWDKLVDAVGGKDIAGKKLKFKSGRESNDTDEFGFSALPGGNRRYDGIFYNVGRYGYWWSAAESGGGEAYYRYMSYDDDNVGEDTGDKSRGFSARCVKNVEKTSFTDPRDGQVYRTVKIGGLVWMAENLNYKIEDSWCYDDDESNGKKYGRLYTWDAAKSACPKGWHLASRQEWDKLVKAAGVRNAGKKLKSKTGWNDNGNGTDKFGFSALPGGYRLYDGSFYYAGYNGYWWSASEYGSVDAYHWHMNYDKDYVYEFPVVVRSGFSARYVAD